MTPAAANHPLIAIGLGGNEGEPAKNLQAAIDRIARLPDTDIVAISPSYWTPPWGAEDWQPDYLNAVVLIRSALSPHELLAALQVIEKDLGRVRGAQRYGPRTLDLDVLVYGNECIDDAVLSVPHPLLHRRGFVLLPLNDIAPALEIPGLESVEDLLAALDPDEIDGIRPAQIKLIHPADG